jgi:IrrE N-terminal-like domain
MSDTKQATIPRSQLRKWSLPRGFKADAKRRSLDVRRAAGFGDNEPLDCYRLADVLRIRIVRLSELEPTKHTHHLSKVEPEALSAATVRRGDRIGIWLNDSHAPERQKSSLAHEIAHVVLDHKDTPPLNDHGCRVYHAGVEAQADYLGSVLLVTDDAALSIARAGTTVADAARGFGVSRQLMQWRVNDSGARVRVQREEQRRASKQRTR